MSSILHTLAEERVVLLRPNGKSLPFSLRGIVRLVDPKGKTLGLVMDKKTLDELEEDLDAQSPTFLASLEASRQSGRVSARTVKRKAGLA